jgi:nucleoside-diphosphate-sugar epimerase
MPRTVPGEAVDHVPWSLPPGDLDDGIERSEADLSVVAGARILVTGGTGFLGSWLVASLIRANARLGLGMQIVVLTRQPASALLDGFPSVSILRGDVRSMPDPGPVDVIVHGAATSSSTYGQGDGDPRVMAATIVDGTRAVLDAAAGRHARVLFLSSGAVYGPQVGTVAEDAPSSLDSMDPRSAYGEAKRLAENLCAAATAAGEVEAVVARLFAFVGPRIPLGVHFAAGNFLDDALNGRPIVVRGDGVPRRSFLYAGELPEWCWALLARGRSGTAYNVGSPDAVTIEALARRAANLVTPAVEVEILGVPSDGPVSWYVPSTALAESEFGLRPRTSLEVGLRKTFAWLSARPRGLI